MRMCRLIQAAILVFLLDLSSASAHDPNTIPDMVAKVRHGVVSIHTKQQAKAGEPSSTAPAPQVPEGSPFAEFFKDFKESQKNRPETKKKAKSLGSGFVIDASGLIVTNNHVIAEADEITVHFADGTKLKVEAVVGRDPKTDIALLRVKPVTPLTALEFADSSKLRLGEQVIAIGNPFGLSHSISSGIVSGLNRDINSGPYDDFIQTDASINRGHTGGPLLNLAGGVIGVSTAIISPSGGSVGVGFAIPSNAVAPVLDTLKKFGETRRGWLGVRIQTVTDEIAESLGMDSAHGAMVAAVTEGSPAETGGILAGDVIIELNGTKLAAMRSLPKAVAALQPGQRATFVVLRKGKRKTLSIRMGLLPEKSASTASAPAPSSRSLSAGPIVLKTLGLTLQDLSADLRSKFSIAGTVKGRVVITDVAPDSTAASKNVQAGDVIMETSQNKVASTQEVAAALRDTAEAGRKSALFLLSNKDGNLRFIALPLAGFKIETSSAASPSGAQPSARAETTQRPNLKDLEKLD